MKVLIVGAELDRCESFMVREIASSGVGITTILDPNQRYESFLHHQNVTVIHHAIRGRVNPLAIRFLRPFFSSNTFDIVHCFSSNALGNVLLSSVGSPIKRVAYRGTSGHMSRLDPSSWLTYLSPGLHKIICVSKAVENYFLGKGVPRDRLITIYKGHDPSWYSDYSSVSLGEFGVPQHAFTVSCVANMRPVKGVDVLISAMKFVPRELPIHLLLIGEVRDDRIKTLIEDPLIADRIHLTGFRSDAPGVVALTNCFVMPSIKREGLPKALIEAMVKKVPPIVTNVGGMPEVVRDGVEGFIVPPSDSKALGAAIVRMYNESTLRTKFANASFERIVKDFNIRQTVEKTLSLYKELSENF